jgi:uncharacterized low-complexity protein
MKLHKTLTLAGLLAFSLATTMTMTGCNDTTDTTNTAVSSDANTTATTTADVATKATAVPAMVTGTSKCGAGKCGGADKAAKPTTEK